MKNDLLELATLPGGKALWRLRVAASGKSYDVLPPRFEVDGKEVEAMVSEFTETAPPKQLPNGCTEHVIEGPLAADAGLALRIVFRIAEGSPVVRFRYVLYVLRSSGERRLTKSSGRDDLVYLRLLLAEAPRVKEVRFSEFRETVHSFCLSEQAVADRAFENELAVMGPMLVAEDGPNTMLVAYEHGSQTPDAFVEYRLKPDRTVELAAVKGNYWSDRLVGPDAPFETIWFQLAAVEGDEDKLAGAYRAFVLKHMSLNTESRRPYVFYNTWAYQERNKWWNDKMFLDSMHQERILAEVDVAHRMGIDVFVLDTGWYEKTGDWRVNMKRFPDGLKAVREKLNGYGMKLGLWFNPLAAAATSAMLEGHRDCVMSHNGHVGDPQPVWETEKSHTMCLVSRYADAFADELIRLVKEVGVTYFKWDAIGQYGCSDPGHLHGTGANSVRERADCYAFELGRSMIHVVDRLCEACPEAIVDFDVTEGGRFVGLGFLAAGKYFLMNNGPYYNNYDVPYDGTRWSNFFVYPGAARTWICREPLSFDKWIPSVLFLTHYLPDDPASSQILNIASLVLGQNGIWGDLLSVSDEGVGRFGEILGRYKQVRDDVTESFPVRTGAVSGSPEVHEKISAVSGRGAIAVFAGARGTYTYVSANKVSGRAWSTEGVEVATDAKGRARLTLTFDEPGAKIVFFGVDEG